MYVNFDLDGRRTEEEITPETKRVCRSHEIIPEKKRLMSDPERFESVSG